MFKELEGIQTKFHEKVLQLVSRIPRGRVTTYKELAKSLGRPQAYRSVGDALARNPRPMEIPCHRVVKSDGRIGGYARGRVKKEELLRKEGIKIEAGKLNLSKYLFKNF